MTAPAASPYGIMSQAPGAASLPDGAGHLLPYLGNFWSDASQPGITTEVDAILQARTELARQEQEDVTGLALTAGLASTPLARTVRWQAVLLGDSLRLSDSRLVYDASDSLGLYPAGTVSTQVWDYPLPSNCTTIALLTDDYTQPAVSWSYGADFTIDPVRGCIRFYADPLSDPRLAAKVITDPVGNRTAVLLAFRGAQDTLQLQQRYGAIFKYSGISSEAYRALLLALNSTWLLGPSRAALELGYAALTGTPICAVDGEVVQQIVRDNDRVVIVTDSNVYEGGFNSTLQVSVGQSLTAGQPLTDGFVILGLSQGTPSAAALPALTIPTPFLIASPIRGGLTFNNASTPLLVSTLSGRTFVSFALGGSPSDINVFWSAVHARGISAGNKTLAQLLDTRPQPQSTDPDPSSLPATINPLDFLVKNVLRYNALVISVRSASLGRWALGTSLLLRVMRSLMAPGQTALVMLDGVVLSSAPPDPLLWVEEDFYWLQQTRRQSIPWNPVVFRDDEAGVLLH